MVIAAVAALFVSAPVLAADYTYVQGDQAQEIVNALLFSGLIADYAYPTGIVETRSAAVSCTSASDYAINNGAVPSSCWIGNQQIFGASADSLFFALRGTVLDYVDVNGVTRRTREILCHSIPHTLADQTPRCAVSMYY